jgi:hypothetical protein
LNGAFASYSQRKNRMRKENGVAHRQYRENPALWAVFAAFGIAGMDDAEKVASHECLLIRLYDLNSMNL